MFLASVLWVAMAFAERPLVEKPVEEQADTARLAVTLVQDPKIDWLLRAHRETMRRQGGIPGFRVQVHVESGNQSRVRIQRAKYEFDSKYPDVKSYIDYDAPYYKLRVGDFRTRLDARRYLEKISRDYRNAFIVVDKINFPELD